MSTEARRAPLPPRPAGPPPPSGPPLARPVAGRDEPTGSDRADTSRADTSRAENPGTGTPPPVPARPAFPAPAAPPPPSGPPAPRSAASPGTRPPEAPGATPAGATGTPGRSSGGKPGIPPRPAGPPPQRPSAERPPAPRPSARRTAPRTTLPPDDDTARLRPVPPAPPTGALPPRPGRPPATPPPSASAFAPAGTSTPLPPPPPGYRISPDTPRRPAAPPAPSHRRPVDLTRPPAARRPLPPPPYRWPVEPPLPPADSTAPLRPVPARRPARTATAIACVVLGLGLIGGAVTGSWLTGDSSADPATAAGYAPLRTLWHSTPVDTFFPRVLKGPGAGPGGADRTWTRVAVAPDGGCTRALDPLLVKALRPVGCERVLRATYVDATQSTLTTVGMVFTEAEPAGMEALDTRFTDEKLGERGDLMPRTYPVKGTVAAGFGDGQRGSWTVNVLTEAPVVVYAVSGFADGRAVPDPQPVARATADGAKTAAAQAGLGHDAKGIADRVERGLRTTASKATELPE
ncbi:hypothetical protein [Streptomyces sp. NPDC058653]|uniref:hypothetical protein n=1 Tax=Streptomyces sp. NPDC058653 TaxID=3346576 RepID=UPI00365BC4C0